MARASASFVAPIALQSACGYTTSTAEERVSKSGRPRARACRDMSPPSSVRVALKAPSTTSGRAAGEPCSGPEPSLASSSMTRVMSFCEASHRLKGSVSWAMRNARSSSGWGRSRCTGAEKPRSTEGTTASRMPGKSKVWEASRSSSTLVGASSLPVARERRPTATGMCSGGAPLGAVEPGFCVSVRRKTPASRSWLVSATTVGVPGCLYHSSNCARSAPLASAMAARKSSQVTAWPSWRSK
mmetsp:Transcript_10930/g.37164  ORF Transcript_10930/g.37164 Transcript_10930/m.37164 type:complete len:242 (+) Transcript_10930:895-1620(+)